MSCAACAANIERALKKLPGIDAAGVNYATNRATVTFDPAVLGVPAIVEAIRDVGYDVLEDSEAGFGIRDSGFENTDDLEQQEREREYRALRAKFVLGTALAIPVVFSEWRTCTFPA